MTVIRHRGDSGEKKARFGRWFGVGKEVLFERALEAKHWRGRELLVLRRPE
jgi:hypothetical protein